MAQQDEDTDKQYEPTQKKLDDARRKGEVPRSADLLTAASYTGFIVAAATVGPATLVGLGDLLMSFFSFSSGIASRNLEQDASSLIGRAGFMVAVLVVPWFLMPAGFVLAVIAVQKNFTVTLTNILPKRSRISPIGNFKQKFGRSGLFEFLKSFAKLSIYSGILGTYLFMDLNRLVTTIRLDKGLVVAELLSLSFRLMMIVLVVALSLGLLDLIWQRSEHIRKNRMSRKELMDEHKESEGDPAMKQTRRQKAIDLALSQMLLEVETANVVIVNPTHFAVALRWNRSAAGAPICVAKGVDDVAARIRNVANQHGVPIKSDPPTARAIYATVELGAEIAHEHYRAVAAAIRFAERVQRKARK